MTRQRQLIYKIIMNTEGHLSADEIFGYAKAEMPSIALGTVYRNLRLMVEDKEIRQIVTALADGAVAAEIAGRELQIGK